MLNDKPKVCKECEWEGRKPTRIFSMSSRSTLAYCPPYQDESGRTHIHDTNTLTHAYKCSNGHSWEEKGPNGTCWCGWGS